MASNESEPPKIWFPDGRTHGWHLEGIAECNRNDAVHHLCLLCSCVLMNAVQVKCGARYCAQCFQVAELSNCRKCKSPHSEGEAFADMGTRLKVDSFKSLCVFAPKCHVEMPINELFNHVLQCPFARVKCPFGCNELTLRGQVTQHDQRCSARKKPCQFCGLPVHATRWNQHLVVCDQRPMTCPVCDRLLGKCYLQSHFVSEHAGETSEKVSQFAESCEFSDDSWKHLLSLDERVLQAAFLQLKSVLSRGDYAALDALSMDEVSVEVIKCARLADEFEVQVKEAKLLVDRCNQQLHEKESAEMALQARLNSVQSRLAQCGSLMRRQQEKMQDIHRNIETQQSYTKDGVFVWKIDHWSSLLSKLKEEGTEARFISSPCFYTGPAGYRMRLRLFPNGEKEQRGKGVSIYITIMRGMYDPILRWPFENEVTLSLLDQVGAPGLSDCCDRKDYSCVLQPELGKSSHFAACRMPRMDTEGNSGFGIVSFIDHSEMLNASNFGSDSKQRPHYIVNDTVFFGATVQPGQANPSRPEETK